MLGLNVNKFYMENVCLFGHFVLLNVGSLLNDY